MIYFRCKFQFNGIESEKNRKYNVNICKTGDETLLYLVVVTNSSSIGKIGDAEIFRITNTNFISLRNCLQDDEKISEVINPTLNKYRDKIVFVSSFFHTDKKITKFRNILFLVVTGGFLSI